MVFRTAVFLAVMMGILCYFHLQHIANNTLKEARQVSHHHLVIQPDQVKVNGNLLIVQGQDRELGQVVSATAFLKESRLATKLAHLEQPLLLTVSGQLQPVMMPTNFNEHDYRPANYHQGIYNQCRINAIEDYQYLPLKALNLSAWRAKLLHYFARFPQPLGLYCGQLLLGQASVDNAEFMESVKRLGIIHLFCISGMHVSVLAWGLRRGLIYCRLTRESIDCILILLLPLYVILGGGSVGLIRAVLMTEAQLIGNKFYSLTALDTWAISLVGGLLINPWLLLTLGGQLSYLLSLSLQVLPSKWHDFKQSLVLNLLSLPSIISCIYQFHWLSFLASFVMIPIFTCLIFPLVVLSAVSFSCWPLIGEVTNRLLIALQRLLVAISHLPGMITFGKPPLIIAIFLLILTVLVLAPECKLRWHWLLLAYFGTFLMIHYYPLGEVTFVDIGQGDSIILRSPFGRQTELIDTGGKLQFQQAGWAHRQQTSDVATRTSVNYLKSRGIKRINTVYLSHHDTDHIGYLPTILQNFRVQQIVVPKGMEKQPALQKLLVQSPNPVRVVGAVADQRSHGSALTVLHPFHRGQANNEDSLVVWGHFGQHNFIFSGDLDRAGERAVIKRYPDLQAEVVKLGHHGSRTASDPLYLRHLQARWGIISAGRQNRYGHPNPETLTTLQRLNIHGISTQQYGMIRYQYFGHISRWQTALKGDELRWTLKNLNNN